VPNSNVTADVVDSPPDEVLQREECMFRGRRWYVPYRNIAEAIWKGKAIVSTDGSASNDNGTYSFVILIETNAEPPTVAFKCRGNLPPLAEYLGMDSHWPEAAALYTALCFTCLLLQDYPQDPASLHNYPLSLTTKVSLKMTSNGSMVTIRPSSTTLSPTMIYFKASSMK
jgi:hypothetical protein